MGHEVGAAIPPPELRRARMGHTSPSWSRRAAQREGRLWLVRRGLESVSLRFIDSMEGGRGKEGRTDEP